MKSRLYFVFSAVILLWVGLVLRAAFLQVLPNERLARLQERQFEKTITYHAKRGAILDREGRELAISVNAFGLFADPSLIKEPKRIAKQLAKIIGRPQRAIERQLKQKQKRFIWLARRLDIKQKERIEKSVQSRGIGFIEESKRIYPNHSTLASVLGFVGSEGKGLEGIEYQFNKYLAGSEQQLRVATDARGRPLISEAFLLDPESQAMDVQLTIDLETQYFLEKELEQAVRQFSAKSAIGVVLDVETSELLALANFPSYDANEPFKTPNAVRRNRAVSDYFEPGSTMKPFVVAAALREGFAEPNSSFFCENGQFTIGNRIVREADATHKWGNLTTNEILARSSNIGSTKIAFAVGAPLYRKALFDFGFGAKTGVQLPGEVAGLVHELPWSKHLLSNASFGHGIAVNALQLASAYNVIANGGMWNPIQIIRSVRNPITEERIVPPSTNNPRRVLTKVEAEKMRLMLMGVTGMTGTAQNAKVDGFPVAGKTGTAQKVDPEGLGYLKDSYISSFAGFIPAQMPRFVIYIVVDSPQQKYYGSQVAAPVFARVASYVVRKAGVPPVLLTQKNLIKRKKLPEVESIVSKLRRDRTIKESLLKNEMPDLSGVPLGDFIFTAQELGFAVHSTGKGVIKATVPSPGHALPSSKYLRVQLSER